MRILIATAYAPPHMGGIEAVAWEQATRFAQRGHSVTWLTTDVGSREAPATSGTPEGVKMIRCRASNPFEGRGIPYPIPGPGFSAAVQRALRGADIVHAHGMLYRTTSVPFRVAAASGVPRVLTCHVIDRARGISGGSVASRLVQSTMHAVERTAHRFVGLPNIRSAEAIVVINPVVRQFVEGITSPARVHAIANGVDIARFRPATPEERRAARHAWNLPAESTIVGFIGRLVPRKGAPIVIAAAPSDAHVLVVGDGSLPDDASRSHGFTRLGAVDRSDVPRLLHAIDILALPSVGEGFPLIVQEAMATGIPVVVSDDPTYAEGERAGAVVAVAPTVDALAPALQALVADEAARRSIGERARRFAELHFSWDEHVSRHLALYESLMVRTPDA